MTNHLGMNNSSWHFLQQPDFTCLSRKCLLAKTIEVCYIQQKVITLTQFIALPILWQLFVDPWSWIYAKSYLVEIITLSVWKDAFLEEWKWISCQYDFCLMFRDGTMVTPLSSSRISRLMPTLGKGFTVSLQRNSSNRKYIWVNLIASNLLNDAAATP